jgi:hypothetical protein
MAFHWLKLGWLEPSKKQVMKLIYLFGYSTKTIVIEEPKGAKVTMSSNREGGFREDHNN